MPDPPIDEEALLDLVDEDSVFLKTLIETFVEDCSDYLSAIRAAVNEGDAETLMREAHGLKGAAANMQAESVRDAAHQLEEIGRSDALERAPEALQELEQTVEHLIPALQKIAKER